MVDTTRRRTLKAIGAGALLGLTAGPAAARGGQRVFVRPVGGQSQAEAALRDHGGRVLLTYDHWDFIAGVVPADNRGDLERDDRVANVENDGVVRAIHHRDGHDGGPPGGGGDDDDGGCSDHPKQSPSWGYNEIGAGEVSGYDGTGVGVAVLDTGVDTEHCDLTLASGTNCTGRGSGYDDKNGHGTHCAGIATADDNDIGVVGVAPGADLYAVKVLDNSGSGYWSWVVCGIDWCMTNGIEIMSMSFGASNMPSDVHTAIDDAYAAGHLMAAAAGNDGHDDLCSSQTVGQPARHPATIAVSALAEDGTVAGYSSVGDEVDLIAPGSDIRSTYAGDTYNTLSGTSMACPHVSGSAATVWEARGVTGPDTSARDEVEAALASTALSVACDNADGEGLVQVDEAVTSVTS